jgi:hypothetical protein
MEVPPEDADREDPQKGREKGVLEGTREEYRFVCRLSKNVCSQHVLESTDLILLQ